MAKTIKELAKIETEGVIGALQQEICERWYIHGANFVLDEIIACFPDTPFCNPNEVIDIITSRIKELKGE